MSDWEQVGDGSNVPLNTLLETKLEGEPGSNFCYAMRHHPDDEIEWAEDGNYGRTTVTHHSFAAPSHWRIPLARQQKDADT